MRVENWESKLEQVIQELKNKDKKIKKKNMFIFTLYFFFNYIVQRYFKIIEYINTTPPLLKKRAFFWGRGVCFFKFFF